ncbi:MAG: hypothetical protein JNK49_18935 [Planctomycetes bacterium]|nr:hypothetical protein [Planctomycetota bacterium]
MQILPLLHWVPLLLAAGSAMAQTYVVDVNNGPGTHFTNLTAAFAAAPDGAVLRVRAGNYFEGPRIDNKSLTIQGDPGATVFPPLLSNFYIENLAPHRVVVVQGLQLGFGQAILPALRCRNNQGLVFVDGVSSGQPSALVVEQCAGVMVRGCQFLGVQTHGLGGASLQQSRVVFDESYVYDLRISGGSTELANSSALGFNGSFGWFTQAITMNGGELRVLGGTLQAPLYFGANLGQAIVGTGTAVIDTATNVLAGLPTYQPGIQVTSVAAPRTRSALPNGSATVTTTLNGPTGSFGVLAVSLRSLPYQLLGPDLWWLDGSVMQVQALGALGAGGTLTAWTTLPATTGLAGQALVWQGLTIASSGAMQLSNPSWFVLR